MQVSKLISSCQSLKNERKSLKINKALVPHFLLPLPALSLTITCGPAPLGRVTCRPAHSVSKEVGADPCESQKGT